MNWYWFRSPTWVQRRKIFGGLLFGIGLGLCDEIPHNNVPGCYQFPYITGLGCMPFQYAFELDFVLLAIAFLMGALP